MDETEKWIKDIYDARFPTDRETVKKFVRKWIRETPMEDKNLAMQVIEGRIEFEIMFSDIYLQEYFEYEKELREKQKVK